MRSFQPTVFSVAVLTLAGFLFIIKPAHAYIDPGTGSFLLQLLIGAVLGATFMLKAFWGKIKVWFAATFAKKQGE